MEIFLSVLIFLWLIGGVIFLFNIAEKAIAFYDTIKSNFKKVLFVLLILILSGPLSWALIIICLVVGGVGMGIIYVIDWVRTKYLVSAWAWLKTWFTK